MPESNENKELNDIIVIGVVAVVGYFGVVKPLLGVLGVTSNADDAIIVAQQNAQPIDNPFNLDWGVQNADSGNLDIYKVGETVHYIADNARALDMGGGTTVFMTEPYAQIALAIYDSVGLFTGDENAMVDALNQITNQYELWQVSLFFHYAFEKDLLQFLKAGYPIFTIDNGMKKSDLSQFIQRVQQMPITYPPGTTYYK